MPTLPVDMFVDAVKTIVKYSQDWIPTGEGESLYIRPFMFATEPGVVFIQLININLLLS